MWQPWCQHFELPNPIWLDKTGFCNLDRNTLRCWTQFDRAENINFFVQKFDKTGFGNPQVAEPNSIVQKIIFIVKKFDAAGFSNFDATTLICLTQFDCAEYYFHRSKVLQNWVRHQTPISIVFALFLFCFVIFETETPIRWIEFFTYHLSFIPYCRFNAMHDSNKPWLNPRSLTRLLGFSSDCLMYFWPHISTAVNHNFIGKLITACCCVTKATVPFRNQSIFKQKNGGSWTLILKRKVIIWNTIK